MASIVKRAEMMDGKRVYVGQAPTLEVLAAWCRELEIGFEQLACVGDNIDALPVLEAVGRAACPSDAARRVLRACDLVLHKRGGDGSVRELLDLYFLHE